MESTPKWVTLLLSVLVATAWPLRSMAEAPPMEYVDHQYQFAFQFPRDWKIEKISSPGEASAVRAIIAHPVKPMRVTAMVSHIGKTITKQQFESSPIRDAAVEAMMGLSVEQVYKKTSQAIGAERMIVVGKQVWPSDAGIKFYISTAHTIGNAGILAVGVHLVPFEKPYMVTFMMITPGDQTATQDSETMTRILSSFHILGERPIE